jgi:hypothetical protein
MGVPRSVNLNIVCGMAILRAIAFMKSVFILAIISTTVNTAFRGMNVKSCTSPQQTIEQQMHND